jgi:uncharacterized protein YwgA
MNRLQLATLLSWAGEAGLDGRKRLQKVVFFLQSAGCPLDCRYTLHHFGPYSRDVADACDDLVAAGLVEESGGPAAGGSYSYKLKPQTWSFLDEASDTAMREFEALGAELIKADIWQLELGSTVLFFFNQMKDWDLAVAAACEFKKVPSGIDPSQRALMLARRVHGEGAN